MEEKWIDKAELYAILSISLSYPTSELARTLVDGSYADTLGELIEVNGLEVPEEVITELASYESLSEEKVLDSLKSEHTRLFLAGETPLISLYGESWTAQERSVQPLLFIGEEARAVEKFMNSCGLGHTQEKHEPLDNISTELEFLKVLCLMHAGEIDVPEAIDLPERAYEDFYQKHLMAFAPRFAEGVVKETRSDFFSVLGTVLQKLPQTAL